MNAPKSASGLIFCMLAQKSVNLGAPMWHIKRLLFNKSHQEAYNELGLSVTFIEASRIVCYTAKNCSNKRIVRLMLQFFVEARW